jgi:hypothetical protein
MKRVLLRVIDYRPRRQFVSFHARQPRWAAGVLRRALSRPWASSEPP